MGIYTRTQSVADQRMRALTAKALGAFAVSGKANMPARETVLLAEADGISTQLLSFTLQREGFEVIEAQGGIDALRLARERHVDLVLSEVLLPDIDGHELCAQLRADWNTRQIPIVLVTSFAGAEGRIKGLRSGADDYLIKPYDVRELVTRLHRLISIYSGCSQLNPLTKLPGSQALASYIDEVCSCVPQRPWALLHLDLNHFRAFNQNYGFEAGNSALRLVGRLLREEVHANQPQLAFAGHDGRDDFVAVVDQALVDSLCRQLIDRFDKEAVKLYPAEDRASDYHVLIDRQGNTQLVPRLSLSIGVVTSDLCEELSYLERREAALAVVNKAKAEEKSSFFVNRRHLVGRHLNPKK
jgi:diguanylate cyclase (GGDEF)-like protein